MITRRLALSAATALMIRSAGAQEPTPAPWRRFEADLARIELESGGRLGVAMLDAGSGAQGGWRVDERFPLCSTFKVLAAAAVLARVDAGQEALDRQVRFSAADLVAHSPVTELHVENGMSLADVCEAAITRSDNTAGNLLLGAIDGPAGLTGFLRGIGDPLTRLDRTELALNEALPGDPRDTTTPGAMCDSLKRLLLGSILRPASRHRLVDWLLASKTGAKRLRAGMPPDWRVGDKTGSGERGTTNDVAIFWLPNDRPVIVTAYLTETRVDPGTRDEVLAKVGQACANALTS